MSLSQKIKEKFTNIDIVLSPALGGIVVGYEIGKQLNVKSVFVERVDGKLTLRRGFSISKKSNVLIVEDVITTGKSVLECSEIVKMNNANLIGYACIIDRTDSGILIKDEIVSQIKFKMSTFKENELPDDLKKITPIKPGSRKQ
jgi:orotate phosphoribosyltransferase